MAVPNSCSTVSGFQGPRPPFGGLPRQAARLYITRVPPPSARLRFALHNSSIFMQNLLRLLLGTTPPRSGAPYQMDAVAYRSFEGGNHLRKGRFRLIFPPIRGAGREDEHPIIKGAYSIYRKEKPAHEGRVEHLAEEVGFEPTRAFALLVFKTSAFNHSAIPPKCLKHTTKTASRPRK